MTTQQRRNRQLIVGIFILSLIPLVLAWLLVHHPDWLGKHSINHGQLISPVIVSHENDYQGFDDFSQQNIAEIKSHWLIVNVLFDAKCAQDCQAALHKSRQLRLMLSKELVRTRRVLLLLHDKNSPLDIPQIQEGWKEDGDLLRLSVSRQLNEQIKALYAQDNHLDNGVLLLIDPLGNIMMRYSSGFNPYDVKSDLMHLLKVSQIG